MTEPSLGRIRLTESGDRSLLTEVPASSSHKLLPTASIDIPNLKFQINPDGSSLPLSNHSPTSSSDYKGTLNPSKKRPREQETATLKSNVTSDISEPELKKLRFSVNNIEPDLDPKYLLSLSFYSPCSWL